MSVCVHVCLHLFWVNVRTHLEAMDLCVWTRLTFNHFQDVLYIYTKTACCGNVGTLLSTVQMADGLGHPLPGVLVSLSGANFRSNNFSKENGRLEYHKLVRDTCTTSNL